MRLIRDNSALVQKIAANVEFKSFGEINKEELAQELYIALIREGHGKPKALINAMLNRRALDYSRAHSTNTRDELRKLKEAGDDSEKLHKLAKKGIHRVHVKGETIVGHKGDETSIFDLTEDPTTSGEAVVDVLHAREQIRHIAQLLNSSDISERNAAIFRAYHELDGGEPRTLQEIGDEFGISESRVCQIMTSLTNQLRAAVDANVNISAPSRPQKEGLGLAPITRAAVQERTKRVAGSLRDVLATVTVSGNTCEVEELDLSRKRVRIRIGLDGLTEDINIDDSRIQVDDNSIVLRLDTNIPKDKDTLAVLVGAQGYEINLQYLLLYRSFSSAERVYIRSLDLSDQEIASSTGLAYSTIRTHAHSIYKKTGWNMEQLTAFAVALRLVKLPKVGLESDEFTDFERKLYYTYHNDVPVAELAEKFDMPDEATEATLQYISDRLDAVTVKLTDREAELLPDYCAGMTYNELAQKLQLSISTVRTHIHNIYDKFQARFKRELNINAFAHGLLPLPELPLYTEQEGNVSD